MKIKYLLFILWGIFAQSLVAQNVPSEVNIQGKIFNNNAPVTGTQNLQFDISNGVNPSWSQIVLTNFSPDGVYSTSINGTNTLNDNLLLYGNPQMTVSIGGNQVATYELESVLTALIARRALNGVPVGGIIMWSGSVAAAHFDATGLGVGEMTGWALCNGNNTTPDLQGKFIAGYDPNNTSYSSIGNTGGNDNVLLTANQSGLRAHTHNHTLGTSTYQHNHTISIATQTMACNTAAIRGGTGCYWGTFNYTTSTDAHSHVITGAISTCPAQNATTPFDNRPSYYTLAYIKRLQ